jgi:hypothetical protein
MTKLLTTAAMFVALATTASANRTGCDLAADKPVYSSRTGELLYIMNSTCPAASGATDGTVEAPPFLGPVAVAAVVPEAPEPDLVPEFDNWPTPVQPDRPTRPSRPRR